MFSNRLWLSPGFLQGYQGSTVKAFSRLFLKKVNFLLTSPVYSGNLNKLFFHSLSPKYHRQHGKQPKKELHKFYSQLFSSSNKARSLPGVQKSTHQNPLIPEKQKPLQKKQLRWPKKFLLHHHIALHQFRNNQISFRGQKGSRIYQSNHHMPPHIQIYFFRCKKGFLAGMPQFFC